MKIRFMKFSLTALGTAMQHTITLAGVLYLTACNAQTQNRTDADVKPSLAVNRYKWTETTPRAAFKKSYNFQLFSIRDTLWAMHPDGAWYSVNGKDFTLSPLTDILKNNAFLDYVWFKGALYALGSFAGNIERFTLGTVIHRTSDMRNWEVVAASSNLPRRFFYHPFVFDNKIWIIGGAYIDREFSDIWNSADGVHWIKQAEGLPFGKRQHSQFVFFHGKIFLLNNDVWSSPDAIHWTREAAQFVPETVFGYAPVVFDGQIWLLGCNRNNVFKSEVLKSSDGKTWTSEKAPWSPRGAAAACVYKDKIFMTGGKYGGLQGKPEFVYSNDVWSLEKVK